MSSFNETWGPTWEVEKTIPGARACVVQNADRSFRSGRPIVDAAFFDQNRKEICRRTGMKLTSKRGNQYVVCRREPEKGTGVDDVADRERTRPFAGGSPRPRGDEEDSSLHDPSRASEVPVALQSER